MANEYVSLSYSVASAVFGSLLPYYLYWAQKYLTNLDYVMVFNLK
jgi:hypothetical protein